MSVNVVDRHNGERFLAAVDEFLAAGYGYTATAAANNNNKPNGGSGSVVALSPLGTAADHAAIVEAEDAYRAAVRTALQAPCVSSLPRDGASEEPTAELR